MTENEKIAMLEDLMECEEGTLKLDTNLDDIDEYDSMTKLNLIVMMEDEFGKKLDAATIKSFQTVGDIVNMMEK